MTDELYHYGIKGMKWGVRRFQETSGRLTNAGKQRYSDHQARRKVVAERKRNRRNASILSDAELNSQINRLQKEKTFRQLSNETLYPGRTAVKNGLSKYGNQAIGAVVGIAVGAIARKWLIDHGYITEKKS